MARRQSNSGDKPPNSRDGQGKPRTALTERDEPQMGDLEGLPDELLSRFAAPGLSLDDAMGLLSENDNAGEIERIIGNRLNSHGREWIELITPRPPGLSNAEHQSNVSKAIRLRLAKIALIDELQKGNLVAIGYKDENFTQIEIKASEWYDDFFFKGNSVTSAFPSFSDDPESI
jgi:hypothetical protein